MEMSLMEFLRNLGLDIVNVDLVGLHALLGGVLMSMMWPMLAGFVGTLVPTVLTVSPGHGFSGD
jgi:hypothetical protein